MTETETEIAPGITGTIDFDELLRLLEREITSALPYGNLFIYEPPNGDRCVNVAQNESGEWLPSCLIGRVLWRSGKVSHELLILNSCASAGDLVFQPVWADESAAALAVYVQEYQDKGHQWGFALLHALIDIGYYTKNEEFSKNV
jgi:hypothetical protein